VQSLARRILHEPEQVNIGKPLSAATTVEQRGILMREEAKSGQLMRLLRQEKGSVIVFTRSKERATRVWRSLHSNGVYDATYIHSDRLQSHREQALADFKAGKYRILIATDVAGRGIHVDDVAHVINYDLPMEPEDYVHRIGRTGRAGSTGRATAFITPGDRNILRQIERILGKPIPGTEPREGGGDRPEGREARYERGGRDADRPARDNGRGGENGHRERPARAAAPVTANREGADDVSGLDHLIRIAGAPVRAGSDHAEDEAADAAPAVSTAAPEGQASEGAPKRRRRRRGGRGRRGKGRAAGGTDSEKNS
jgi:ATP-dependent RNA helicase RhlE